MGQVLHGSASTTAAIRRAIQNSQESLRTLAKRHGINPKTVAKWRSRSNTADVRPGPKDAHSTVLSIEEEAIIVAFRSRHFETLLNIGPDIEPRAIVADKGYASKANRATARARGIAPVIPHKANEKNKPAFFAKTIYKARGRIEQAFGRLKRYKRVALRCQKTAQNFASIVSFAAGLCLIKLVHTA